MSRQISLRLPEALLRRLDRALRSREIMRSDFIRRAIELHLQDLSGGPASRPYERVRHLIGSVRGSGPSDLASRHSHYLRVLFRGRR